MSAITGIYKNGYVILKASPDWPEGCEVTVKPVADVERIGMTEEEWVDTPEAIAAWLAWYDSLEPLEMTPEEEADLTAWRQKVKEYSINKAQQRIEGLFP